MAPAGSGLRNLQVQHGVSRGRLGCASCWPTGCRQGRLGHASCRYSGTVWGTYSRCMATLTPLSSLTVSTAAMLRWSTSKAVAAPWSMPRSLDRGGPTRRVQRKTAAPQAGELAALVALLLGGKEGQVGECQLSAHALGWVSAGGVDSSGCHCCQRRQYWLCRTAGSAVRSSTAQMAEPCEAARS